MKQYHGKTCAKFPCQLTEACHVLYNLQLDDKRESELKDWCWDTDHLFPGQEDQFLEMCIAMLCQISNN